MNGRPGPPAARLEEIAGAVGGTVVGAPDTMITGVSSLAEAVPGDIAYVESEGFAEAARGSRAAAFVVASAVEGLGKPQVIVAEPRFAFVRIVESFFTAPRRARGVAREVTLGADVVIGPEPSIWPFVTLGNRVRLGARVTLYPGVFVGDDALIGDDTVLHPNVTVRERCSIGARVIVHSGAVIGSDGFGFAHQSNGTHYKIPQVGGVVVEDDVEIGANTTIDRPAVGETRIGAGSKIDNLVQVAHGVTIGRNVLLAAQVGIAGSTTIEESVTLAGQVGVAGHLTIGTGVIATAQTGIPNSVEAGAFISGYPAIPNRDWLKSSAVFRRLPEMRKQVAGLEARIRELEARLAEVTAVDKR